MNAIPRRLCRLSVLCLLLLAASTQLAVGADTRDGPGKRWSRTNPFPLMGLTLLEPTYDVTRYREAGFNYLLAWKFREGILRPSADANLPWFGHLEARKEERVTDELKSRVRALMKAYPGNVGLLVNDEPKLTQMGITRDIIAWLRSEYPGRLFMSNIYPIGATGARYAGDAARTDYTYSQYVRDYVRIVEPPVLMFDVYPFRKGRSDGTVSPSYYMNLSIIRKEALAAGIPYWVFIQAYENVRSAHRLPSESDVRMQTFSSLTFGFTGLAFFSYDAVYERGLTEPGGSPNGLYRDVQKLSDEVMKLGASLKMLTSTHVYALAEGGRIVDPAYVPTWKAGAVNADRIRAIHSPSRAPGMIGYFVDESGSAYFMLTNLAHGSGSTARATEAVFRIVFDPEVKTVLRLNRQTGRTERLPIVRPSEGLTVTLPGGTGDLYKYDNGPFAGAT